MPVRLNAEGGAMTQTRPEQQRLESLGYRFEIRDRFSPVGLPLFAAYVWYHDKLVGMRSAWLRGAALEDALVIAQKHLQVRG